MGTTKFSNKHRDFGIKNLMFIIVSANILIFLLSMFTGVDLITSLALIPSKVFEGQVWRLISYVLIPPSTNPIFFIFAVFLYYTIGRELEYFWGTFKFNIYYFMGVILISITSMLFGVPVYSVGDLNMSLFLAYTVLNPEHTVYLYMIIPIKMKYMAIVTLTIIGYRFLTAPFFQIQLIILAPIVNFLIFFLPQFIKGKKQEVKSKKRKDEFKGKVLNFDKAKVSRHRCSKCGITDIQNNSLEFRYCSKCNGNYEYCSDHIFDHDHKE